jgi:hypothetical protein
MPAALVDAFVIAQDSSCWLLDLKTLTALFQTKFAQTSMVL